MVRSIKGRRELGTIDRGEIRWAVRPELELALAWWYVIIWALASWIQTDILTFTNGPINRRLALFYASK
jgi:hypothetical protein